MKAKLTNTGKILFPESKITKGDLIEYYQKIAPYMIPKIKNRPISMLRYPNGIHKGGFFQKNISDFFPTRIQRKRIVKKGGESISMIICNDSSTLAYLANLACITPHIWLSRIDKIRYPDRMIFDLDPPPLTGLFSKVVDAAKTLRKLLEKELRLTAFVMTTGSKGLHVVVPIKRELKFSKVRAFARSVAEVMVQREPSKYTTNPRLGKRGERIFIDYLRNGYAQTGVAPYAVRPLEGAPVAAPISWEELTPSFTVQKYTLKNMLKRAKRKDPWRGIDRSARSLMAPLRQMHAIKTKSP